MLVCSYGASGLDEEGCLQDAVTAEYSPFNLNSDPSDCPHGLTGCDSLLVLFSHV